MAQSAAHLTPRHGLSASGVRVWQPRLSFTIRSGGVDSHLCAPAFLTTCEEAYKSCSKKLAKSISLTD